MGKPIVLTDQLNPRYSSNWLLCSEHSITEIASNLSRNLRTNNSSAQVRLGCRSGDLNIERSAIISILTFLKIHKIN